MRLVSTDGKKYYCGRLRYAPNYAYDNEYRNVVPGRQACKANVTVDGNPVVLNIDLERTWTKNTVFQIGEQWYYISNDEFKGAIMRGLVEGAEFTTAGSVEKQKRTRAYDRLFHLIGGVNWELVGDSAISGGESNDCTVYALMHAAHISYDDAHRKLRPYRSKGKSVQGFRHVMRMMGGFEEQMVGRNKITLGTFVQDAVGGRYVVGVRGHALAVVDGKVYDNGRFRPGCKIDMVFKFVG